MSQIIPIYIPTYISDQNYNPARILPRLFFYNGLIGCEQYYIQDENFSSRGQTEFPYFDNYNVVSGNFPTTDSKSLLFNNEGASYGEVPTESLYTTYWEKYISLLYNPYTRLLNASAIIPLADYFNMQLNDVVNFRGNYYHLRAINDYSIKTGECNLQLLGPIIPDTFNQAPPPPPAPAANATASIYLNEFTSASVFIDANLIVSGTAYYFAGQFTQSISGGAIANVVMEGKDGGSTTWGGYTTASATLTIKNNGTAVTSSTQYIYSGSGDMVITFPTTFTAGHNITISGSTTIVGTPTPPPNGTFIIDAQYGMNITNIASSTGTMPSFTYPQNSGATQQSLSMVSGFDAANQFEITLSGTRTPATNKSVRVYVNNVEQACSTISTDGSQTKYLTITPATLISDNVRISIASSAC
jgi:hypothetical protein